MVKQCPPCSATFICNPGSGRCVSRTGPTGTKLLEEARALLSDNVNVISQDRIPRWRRHVQKFDSGTGEHVYDVHGLATMIDHASRPQVIIYDDMTRQIIQPHRPKWPLTGREMTAAEVDAIMLHASLTEWARPAETAAVSNANRRVPRNLAVAQAGARAARNAARARQEAEERRQLDNRWRESARNSRRGDGPPVRRRLNFGDSGSRRD